MAKKKSKRKKSAPGGGSNKGKKSAFLEAQRGVTPVFVNKFGSAPKQAARIRSQVTRRKAV